MEAKHQMTQLAEWADQYRAEIEKLASARAAQLESLLITGDFTACREWLNEWEAEDSASDSLREKYRQTVTRLKMSHCCNWSNGISKELVEASAENLGRSSASSLPTE
jgi:hypothetical protein